MLPLHPLIQETSATRSARLPAANKPLLDASGWSHNNKGKVAGGRPQWISDSAAHFKHAQPLASGDVWRCRVEFMAGVLLGFAGQAYDPERHGETYKSIVKVDLDGGNTFIGEGASLDGQEHSHFAHMAQHVPKTTPYDVALRINKGSKVPEVQFNEDGAWHVFAFTGRTALKDAVPMYPYISIEDGDSVIQHIRVENESMATTRATY
jgi:hypothetical protein